MSRIADCRLIVLFVLVAGCSMSSRVPDHPTAPPPVPAPRTVPESTDYRRTSSHAEVLAFLDAVGAAHDPVSYTHLTLPTILRV